MSFFLVGGVVRGLGGLVGFGLMDCDVGVLGVIVLLWGVMEVVVVGVFEVR